MRSGAVLGAVNALAARRCGDYDRGSMPGVRANGKLLSATIRPFAIAAPPAR
jgi:hypothetical protein